PRRLTGGRAGVLRPERGRRVGVARIPEHPADAAGFGRGPDLGLDLAHPEEAMVERIVPEVLEPRAHAHDRLGRALADQTDTLVHDLVWVRDGVAEAGNAEMVPGRVDHRAEVVDVRRHLLDPLADVGV